MIASILSALLLDIDTPAGFRPVGERTALDAGDKTLEWQVTQDFGVFRIEKRADWLKRTDREAALWRAKPGSRKVKLSNATATWQPGEGVKVIDGWIQGFEMGEFGGGIFWRSANGKSQRLIDRHNTDLVARLGNGLYAVQSLTHMIFWYSQLVRLDHKAKGWVAVPVTDLHVAPSAVVVDGRRFLYVTNDYVSILETDGRQHEVLRWTWEFHPGTMIRRTNGDVWLGGVGAIVRLRLKPSGDYTAQWFLPLK